MDGVARKFYSPDEKERLERFQNASTVTSLKVTRAQTAPGWQTPKAQALGRQTPREPAEKKAAYQPLNNVTYRSAVPARVAQTYSGPMRYPVRVKQTRPVLLDGPLQQKEHKKLRGLIVKTVICAVLLGTVLLLKYIDAPQTKALLQSVYAAVTQDMDIDDTLGKLKFVNADPDGSVTVSGGALNAALPGEVTETFASSTDGRVCVSMPYGATVRAPLGATVLQTGQSADGGYISLSCEQDVHMTFYNLDNIPFKAYDTVTAGQSLGTAGASGLVYIAAEQNGQSMNPIPLFDNTSQ